MYSLNLLREARASAGDINGEFGAYDAFQVANCLGRCRVNGTQIPVTEDGPMSLNWARRAVEHGRWLTQRVKQGVERLIVSQNEVVEFADEFYDEDCRTAEVHTRHELWCALIAIVEADESGSKDQAGAAELVNELCLFIEELSSLDVLMIQHVGLFSCAADTNLLTNLRAMTKVELLPKLEPLPWWLDGTIEQARDQAEKRLLESLPDPVAIERRRHGC